MRPECMIVVGIVLYLSACAKGTEGNGGQTSPLIDWAPWVKKEDNLVSTLQKKQDASLVRLAQQRALQQAMEEQALKERAIKERSSRRSRVPPSMYRTTEPPLPEPDLSLPVQDVPRSAPAPSPR
jgi:hypothetical protein